MPKTPVKDGFELSDTHRTLPMALLRAREQVMERFRPLLQAHGVTEQQWRVLRVLNEGAVMEASELAEAASILAPSLSRILKTLETRGFIETAKSQTDARRTETKLTAAGQAFIRQVAPESAAIYAGLEQKIGRQRIEALLDGLEALLAALK